MDMNKGLSLLSGGHRSVEVEGSWRWPSCEFERQRQRHWAAPLGNFNPSFSGASRRRQGYYEYRSARHFSAVDGVISHESRALRSRRHFSEDSGFSSCGSSTSSVVDDSETPPGLKIETSCPTDRHRLHSYHGAASKFGSQSDTVAAVLAAGVSDSEDADNCDSDEESDSVFDDDEVLLSSSKVHDIFSSRLSSARDSSMVSQLRCFLNKVVSDGTRKSKGVKQENVKPSNFGRDILDLGSNLTTKFPIRSTELPAMNLALFLQNRSQYHRLGKFGTSESFPSASCVKQCGFSFPIPPAEDTA